MAGEAHQRLNPAGDWLFCDLDGTLMGRGEACSESNWNSLAALRRAGMKIVPATGRNWKTLHEALAPDAPVDYAVFSTGAGIVDWRRQEPVRGTLLPAELVQKGLDLLLRAGVNFALHYNWPDNHRFVYHAAIPEAECRSDFFSRIRHNADGAPLVNGFCPGDATGFLVIFPAGDEAHAAEVAARFDARFSVVRATSPADGRSIWMEIFAAGVNKASAAAWLTKQYGRGETFAIGNDHNDLALLEWADHALVMPDAPEELKRRFPVIECDPAHLLENIWTMPGWEKFCHNRGNLGKII